MVSLCAGCLGSRGSEAGLGASIAACVIMGFQQGVKMFAMPESVLGHSVFVTVTCLG